MNKKKITIAVVAVIAVIAIAIIVSLLNKDTKTVYTISFNTNGGKEVVSSQEIEDGKTVTKPANPTKDGYEFLGWYLNGEYFDFKTPVEENMTLEAKWKEIIVDEEPDIKDEENKDEVVEDNKDDEEETTKVTTYTVKFESNGGSKVASKTVEKNKTVKAPTDPTKDGYIFKGWYLGSTKYDFSKKVTKNITLTAKWEKVEEEKPEEPDTPVTPEVKEYTVTFNTDGGSSVKAQTVKENETASNPSNPTRKWDIFKGWYLDGKLFDFNTKITKNITLTAKWDKVDYSDSEKVTGSYINQVRIYVLKNNVKVAGTVDIKYGNGKTVTVNVPATGYIEVADAYTQILNVKVK